MSDEPLPVGCHPSDCCGDPSVHLPPECGCCNCCREDHENNQYECDGWCGGPEDCDC